MKTTKVQFNFIADVILSNTHYKNNPSLSVSWHFFKKMIRKLKIEQRYPKNHLNLIEWSKPWCFLFNSQISQQLNEKPWCMRWVCCPLLPMTCSTDDMDDLHLEPRTSLCCLKLILKSDFVKFDEFSSLNCEPKVLTSYCWQKFVRVFDCLRCLR